MIIFKEFTFDSAHALPHVPDGHKCKQVHGHTYYLKVYIEGALYDDLGWVMDFSEVKKTIKPVIDRVDHKYLNDIEGLENPTCEIISKWLWKNIKVEIPSLHKIELYETPTSGVIYQGA